MKFQRMVTKKKSRFLFSGDAKKTAEEVKHHINKYVCLYFRIKKKTNIFVY